MSDGVQMSDDVQEQLRNARQRQETRDTLRAERVASQDQLKSDAYRLQYLERYVAEIAGEIERSENPGFLKSLLGNPAVKVERLREEQFEMRRQADELTSTVDSVQHRLNDIERQLEGLSQVDEECAAVLRQAEQAMVRGDGNSAERFSAVSEQYDLVQDRIRKIERAAEAGQYVLQRLGTMSKALNRSRRKHFHGIGPLNATWNAIQNQIADPSVSRAREGLDGFAERAREVDTSAGGELDLEINRRIADVVQRCAELAAGWTQAAARDRQATFPVEDEVREVLRLLELKQDLERKELDRLEREKNALLTGASTTRPVGE